METISLKNLRVLVAVIPGLFSTGIEGLSSNDVVLINNTGLPIVRIEIDSRKLEALSDNKGNNKIMVTVTPKKHHLRLVYRGGGDVNWPHFDFHGVHEITFERSGGNFTAHTQ